MFPCMRFTAMMRPAVRRTRILSICLFVFTAAAQDMEPSAAASTQPLPATGSSSESIAARIDAKVDEAIAQLHLPSIAVGVIRDNQVFHRRAVGVVDRESLTPATCGTLYAIGSVTKTFTATLLVMLRDEGVVALDDPISRYLPPDLLLPFPSNPRGDAHITLRHLATHTSGLPRLPPNLMGFLPDPYGSYTAEHLYQALASGGLIAPIGSKYQYSNFGMGLLGHLLERAAGRGFDELLQQRIFRPLEMTDSHPRPTPELMERMARPYKGERCEQPANSWTFGVLAPAGSIVSSVDDMLKYVAFQFGAGEAVEHPLRGGSLRELHRPQRLLDERWNSAVGLGWHVTLDRKLGEVVWHNGGLDGFHSFVGFLPKQRAGVVVLTNCDKDIDRLAMEILRIAGAKPNAE